jgi:hypothetical protein
VLERLGRVARLDLQPGAPPRPLRLVVATIVSLVLSLGLSALAVHVARVEFPSTRHFSHFLAADYGTLTVVGVLLAAGVWAVLVRVSSAAHWLFFRLAVISTLVLWIPDAVPFRPPPATHSSSLSGAFPSGWSGASGAPWPL